MDIQTITSIITNLGFPIVCVVGLAWYSKGTTDKIIDLTERVTDALAKSTDAVDDIKEVIKEFMKRSE